MTDIYVEQECSFVIV